MELKNGKMFLSWEDVEKALDLFYDYYMKEGLKFDGVYGIPRGGLVPAVCLSHRLDLPLLMAPTKHTLVVDDIADTGKTLTAFINKNFIFTVCYHPQSTVRPNWFLHLKGTEWVVFPWEKEESSR